MEFGRMCESWSLGWWYDYKKERMSGSLKM
jgi:hypothetical protein